MPVKDYMFSLMLGNPKSPYITLSDGYAGDGGIPGYIIVSLVPNEYTISRVPAALVHECNHNVRFQFEKWKNDITLGEMMSRIFQHIFGVMNLQRSKAIFLKECLIVQVTHVVII